MALGLLGAACLAIAAGLLVQMHLLDTGLDPVRDAVSLYGTTRIHRHYRAMVIALGLSALLIAIGLRRDTDAHHLIWLWIFGSCRIAIAGFMMDGDRTSPSVAGRVHLLLAVGAFTAIAFAGAKIDWSGAPGTLHPVGRAIVASVLATAVARFSPMRLFGLAERLIYATALIWLTIAAASLIAGS
jgi:hypothetical protein